MVDQKRLEAIRHKLDAVWVEVSNCANEVVVLSPTWCALQDTAVSLQQSLRWVETAEKAWRTQELQASQREQEIEEAIELLQEEGFVVTKDNNG